MSRSRRSSKLFHGFALILASISVADVAEAPRPLAGRARQNLEAFTRLLGYVRYFHPSDGAAQAEWDRFAIESIELVEGARDPRDLAARLENRFRPIAPTVRVMPTGTRLEPPPPAAHLVAARRLAWLHSSESRRVEIGQPSSAGEARIWRSVDAAPYRGRRVRFRAAARAVGTAELFAVVRGADAALAQQVRPIVSEQWSEYELTVEVAADSRELAVGFEVAGDGSAWVDEVAIDLLDGDPERARTLALRDGFEESPDRAGSDWPSAPVSHARSSAMDGIDPAQRDSTLPPRWQVESRAVSGTYRASTATDAPFRGRGCALLDGSRVDPAPFPAPNETITVELPGGVTATVPLTAALDAAGTLPRSVVPDERAQPGARDVSGNDRSTRLAAVALAWNIPRHFYPYFDVVEDDWDAALGRALSAAAADRDAAAFGNTLRRMLVALHDSHGRVQHAESAPKVRPPMVFRWIEGRPIVTHVAEGTSGIRPGDALVAFDGVPIEDALEELYRRTPGATWQWRRQQALLYLGAEVVERPATLELESPDGSRKRVVVQLAPGRVAYDEPRPPSLHEVRPDIFYVDVTRFSDEEFEAALEQLVAANGVIFDLRGYPHPELSVQRVLPHLASTVLESPPIGKAVQVRPGREQMRFVDSGWSIEPATPRFGGTIAFLTDGRAISAAETWLSLVKHYGLGVIVGGPTAGTNGGAYPETLPGGYRFYWTGYRVLKHDGSQHHGIGVLPDIPVQRSRKAAVDGRDELLDQAIDWIVGTRNGEVLQSRGGGVEPR